MSNYQYSFKAHDRSYGFTYPSAKLPSASFQQSIAQALQNTQTKSVTVVKNLPENPTVKKGWSTGKFIAIGVGLILLAQLLKSKSE